MVIESESCGWCGSKLLKQAKQEAAAQASLTSTLPPLSSSSNFPQTSFFEDQLTAFDVWLQFASEKR